MNNNYLKWILTILLIYGIVIIYALGKISRDIETILNRLS